MLPVVWLRGPSGVGKSTVGHLLAGELSSAGVPTAFVDADQLRLASVPESEYDALIADGLVAVDGAFAAAGARALVVAGLVTDETELVRLLPGLDRDRVLVCRLDVGADTLRARFVLRGWMPEGADDAVASLATARPEPADVAIDTTERHAAEVAAALLSRARAHLGRAESLDPVPEEPVLPTLGQPALLVTGPPGVGCSTVGFGAFLALADPSRPTGYLDAEQLGFLSSADPVATLRARATNVMRVVGVHAAHGIGRVVVAADLATAGALASAEPDVAGPAGLVILTAGADSLEQRLSAKANGEGPALMGERRVGWTADELRRLAQTGAAQVERMRQAHPMARVIETDGLEPGEVVARLVSAIEE